MNKTENEQPINNNDEGFMYGYNDEMTEPPVGWLSNPYKDNTTEARHWVDGKVKAMQDKRMIRNQVVSS